MFEHSAAYLLPKQQTRYSFYSHSLFIWIGVHELRHKRCNNFSYRLLLTTVLLQKNVRVVVYICCLLSLLTQITYVQIEECDTKTDFNTSCPVSFLTGSLCCVPTLFRFHSQISFVFSILFIFSLPSSLSLSKACQSNQSGSALGRVQTDVLCNVIDVLD